MSARVSEYELRSMSARVVELERERADARDQVRSLSRLQETLGELAVERRPERVKQLLLEAAHDPLGFGRAMFLECADECVTVRYESTLHDGLRESVEAIETPAGGALSYVLLGSGNACSVGRAGELGLPLVDTRGWYALVPLRRSELFGLLYLDDNRYPPRGWEVPVVETLAAIGTIALENTVLFDRLERLASHDPLTGLLNRRAFGDRLLQQLESAKRARQTIAFAVIDVDDFKQINDTKGHAYGDAVLRKLAAALLRYCRANDVAGRFAGDEFVLALVDIDPALATQMIDRLSRALSLEGLHCSIGVSLFPGDAHDAASLFEASDRALYAAKAAGKNTYAFASPIAATP